MSAKGRTNSVSSILSNLFSRNRQELRKRKSLANRGSRKLQMEGLEKREMFAVTGLYLNPIVNYSTPWAPPEYAVTIGTDNNSTSVSVSQSGATLTVNDYTTNRHWDFAASIIKRVEFYGGNGADRFVNYIGTMPVWAYGGGGNDYLEGYSAADILDGGAGNDTLVGFGGDDTMQGGADNDLIQGNWGDDRLYGGAGRDHIDGGSDHDKIWGGADVDTLLGGAGDDELYGDAGNDHLNGQAGFDKMWGGADDDVLIAIDAAYNELVDSGTGADTMWIDSTGSGFISFNDKLVGATSLDVIQRVGSFANGADNTLDGDNIADPTDIGEKARFTNTITAGNTAGSNPLFSPGIPTMVGIGGMTAYLGSGPRSTDIVQGNMSDCWLLAGVGSIANKSPNVIRQNVVDFDDGTYGVRLGNSFYRVDNELPVWNASSGAAAGNLRNAQLGTQNSMWVAIVEKAYAAYGTSANTYSSLNMGNLGGPPAVYTAFRLKDVTTKYLDDYKGVTSTLASDLNTKWKAGYTLAIGSMAIVGGGNHEFSVERLNYNSTGAVTSVLVRNPWGYDGLASFVTLSGGDAGTDANDGFFTLTVAQLVNARGWLYWGQA